MGRGLRLFPDGKITRDTQAFQILALSGGGYRGLFTAAVLEQLEKRAGWPLNEIFDLIAGTSIGGIIATGLACGVTASHIRASIEDKGQAIFDRRLRVRGRLLPIALPRLGVFGNRYSAVGLGDAIAAVLGQHADLPICDVSAPLMVISVSRTNASPVIFESDRAMPPERCTVTLRNTALATSAAPTYFPQHRVDQDNLIDGGLIANAPDGLALMRALGRFGKRPDNIRIISIGTAGGSMADLNRPAQGHGAVRWMLRRRLFDVTIKAQESLSINLASEVLGDRYIRIDAEPSPKQRTVIGLDITSKEATGTLLEMASRAVSELPSHQRSALTAILRQKAIWAAQP